MSEVNGGHKATYLQLDVDYATHDKVAELSCYAKGLDVSAMAWSKKSLTDGRLNRRQVEMAGLAWSIPAGELDGAIGELIEAGRWAMDGAAFVIAGWSDWNRSADEVRAAKGRAKDLAATRQRKKRERDRKAADASSCNDSVACHADVTLMSRDVTAQTETETEIKPPLTPPAGGEPAPAEVGLVDALGQALGWDPDLVTSSGARSLRRAAGQLVAVGATPPDVAAAVAGWTGSNPGRTPTPALIAREWATIRRSPLDLVDAAPPPRTNPFAEALAEEDPEWTV